jgi:starch synthase
MLKTNVNVGYIDIFFIFLHSHLKQIAFMEKTKVLFVTQAIDPFFEGRSFAALMRKLSQGAQESECEIRVFMPRFGVINERRHQLHEVIRLSGMNLIINDSDHPLIIKVASIPQARMQVYFIDNDEYFKRKRVFETKEGTFSEDNDERAMFFGRGVLETVKKLGWRPDVVHCHGWMTGFTPLYLKTMYANDPHFSDASIVYTSYGDNAEDKFTGDVMAKLAFDKIDAKAAEEMTEPTVANLNKLAVKYSDGYAYGTETINDDFKSYIASTNKPVLEYADEENTVASHQEFYKSILSENEVAVD